MLILARKVGQKIVINGNITVTVLEITGERVRIGVDAPKNIPVNRQEVQQEIDDERRAA